MTITLKSLYILGLLYAVGLMTKKMTKRDIEGSYKRGLFAEKVKKNVKVFDGKKWESFIKRPFI